MPRTLSELLEKLPTNWGRWGADDELGSLNYLGAAEVLRGVAEIREGAVFTLGAPIADPRGDPAFPGIGRDAPRRRNSQDYADYLSGKAQRLPGGLEFADDEFAMGCHAGTHIDGLGHTWIEDRAWNGYSAEVTIGSMQKASVLPIAEHGVVGRGVLLDIPRLRGKARLDRGEAFSHADLLAAAAAQGVVIQKHDILLIRTGAIGLFYEIGAEAYTAAPFVETGLTYSEELVRWYHELELPMFATDTIGNEYTDWEHTELVAPLHAALMRNLGVLFAEILWLDDLAAACAARDRWTFFVAAAPLKVVGGTAALVNPIAIL